ncbi:MAG: hypothetical protein JW781_08695 [Deltaproteobacteria bacterium]|nr:hypothetical protein [Candidatus Anaeroferrophillacea bacterium]
MKKLMALVVLLGLFLIPSPGLADEIVGTVQGFQCVTTGRICPIGKEDPVIAAERVFVVITAAGDYYFVPNLDRAIMARNITNRVRVTGMINQKFKSIRAKTLEVRQDDGSWKMKWSEAMEKEMLDELYRGGGG